MRAFPGWILSAAFVFGVTWYLMDAYISTGSQNSPSFLEWVKITARQLTTPRKRPIASSPSDWQTYQPLREYTALDPEEDRFIGRLVAVRKELEEVKHLDAAGEPMESWLRMPAPQTETKPARNERQAPGSAESVREKISRFSVGDDVEVASFVNPDSYNGELRAMVKPRFNRHSLKTAGKKKGWSGWFTMNYPLDKPQGDNAPDARDRFLSTPSLTTAFQYRPNKWFARLSFYKYFDEQSQGTWDPDFSFKFGYRSWRKNSISFDYYNGGRNRLNPNKVDISGHYSDAKLAHLEEGTFTLKYNLPIGEKLPNWLSLTNRSSAGAHLRLITTPKVDYLREQTWSTLEWQRSASLYSWYNITDTFYVAGTVYYYPEGHQMSWDPDYTYEFGIADWSPGKLSLEYGNYSQNNRFGYNEKASKGSSFFDGTLSLSLYWTF